MSTAIGGINVKPHSKAQETSASVPVLTASYRPRIKPTAHLSFRTAEINKNLAQRLNKKKVEARALRDDNIKLKIQLASYKRFIFHLRNQKNEMKEALTNISTEFNNRYESSSRLMVLAIDEMNKLGEFRDNIDNILSQDDQENMSYIANTSLLTSMQRPAANTRSKHPLAVKQRHKAVNMVRPMKYGYVVGNPVVSLRRLRRIVPTPVPLENVQEDEEEEETETTVVEIAPTPSGLPSPSSPEAASTSTTPEPRNASTSATPERRNLRTSASPEPHNASTNTCPVRRSTSSNTVPVPRREIAGDGSQRVGAAHTPSAKEQQKDSIKSKRPEPKARERKSLAVAAALAKCAAHQGRASKATPSPAPRLSASNQTFTISKTQQLQLNSPCRVLVKNLSTPVPVPVPVPRRSSDSPVVVLDRITLRKKLKGDNHSDTDGTSEQESDECHLDDIKEENESRLDFSVALDDTLVDSKQVHTPPVLCMSSKVRFSKVHDSAGTQDMDITLGKVSPLVLFKSVSSKKRKSSLVLSTIEESPVANKSKLSLSTKCNTNSESSQSTERTATTHPNKIIVKALSKLKSTPGDVAEGGKEDDVTATRDDNDETEEVKKPMKEFPKKNKPMPLSKKLMLQQFKGDCASSEEESSNCNKKVAQENSDGMPHDGSEQDADMMRSDPTVSDSNKSYSDFQDSEGSYESSESSVLSPAERIVYMKNFLERVSSEDPLEGTSSQFEPKKKENKEPCKKSQRLREKKDYTESPISPVKSKTPVPLDESWRPVTQRKRPRSLSKKRSKKRPK